VTRSACATPGSANGTLVNEVISTEAELRTGDRIGVGPLVFHFEAVGSDERVEPPDGRGRQHGEAFPADAEFIRRQLEEGKTSAMHTTDRPRVPPKTPSAVAPIARGHDGATR